MLPFVTAEDQSTAMVKASEACELLKDSPSMTLGLVLDILPGHEFASIPIVSPAEAAELRIGFKVPKTRIQNFKVEGGKEPEGGRRGSSSYSCGSS
uniref:Uncharacterized protein n=1 Tax=Populus trichocarpa TaxID=3694 RepID=A0A3N7G2N9_POPTR